LETEYYYGAAARASALIAGYPDWFNVTKWPIEDEEWEDAKIYD